MVYRDAQRSIPPSLMLRRWTFQTILLLYKNAETSNRTLSSGPGRQPIEWREAPKNEAFGRITPSRFNSRLNVRVQLKPLRTSLG